MAYNIGTALNKMIGTAEGGQRGGGNGAGSVEVKLDVITNNGDYQCATTKKYVEKSSIIIDLDSSDGFLTLASFSKSKAALTVHNAKVIVVKNLSNIASEIAITTHDWRNDSDSTTTDVQNSVDLNVEDGAGEETVYRTWSMILPAGDFIYLPTSRIISYSPLNTGGAGTLESAANSAAGLVSIEPKDIYSGNEIKHVKLFAGSTYGSGAFVLVNDGDATATSTELTVDDGDWFEVGDKLSINGTGGHEIVEIESISGTTLTLKRAVDGSTARVLANDSELYYAFHNHYLPYDNGKCMTDQNGKFKQTGAFFGYGRSADKVAKGVCAGTVSIGPFYTRGGSLDWGLQNIKASDSTGLAVSTTYAITVVCDEFNAGGIDSTSTEQIVSFTTDSSDVSFAGSSVAVIPKLQAAIDSFFYDESSGLKNKKITIGLVNGDIRMQSHSNHSETIIGIAKASSGTTPFDVGRFPTLNSNVPVLKGQPVGGGATDTIVYGPASSLDLEEIEDRETGKTIKNTNAFIFDDGKGNLTHNGNVVGWIDYAKGHCEFTHLPNAEFKINAETLAAHSGGVNWSNNAQNTLYTISGRSLNSKQDSKLEVLLLG